MRIILLGDLHGRFSIATHVIEHALSRFDDVCGIIQVGDFGYGFGMDPWEKPARLGDIPFYFIEGNHDDYLGLCMSKPPIYGWCNHVRRGEQLLAGGKRILCMGGATSIDKMFRTEGVTWWPEEEPTYRQITECMDSVVGKRIDIMITHDFPGGFKAFEEGDHLVDYPAINGSRVRSGLQAIYESMVPSPKWSFFGHWHQERLGRFNWKRGVTHWACLPDIRTGIYGVYDTENDGFRYVSMGEWDEKE